MRNYATSKLVSSSYCLLHGKALVKNTEIRCIYAGGKDGEQNKQAKKQQTNPKLQSIHCSCMQDGSHKTKSSLVFLI
jgi:hypothetical protein